MQTCRTFVVGAVFSFPDADGALTCTVAADCTSGVCMGGVCQVASCYDAVQNGTETGIVRRTARAAALIGIAVCAETSNASMDEDGAKVDCEN